MKKFMIVLCVLTCLFSFTACSNSDDSSKTKAVSEYINEETMMSISSSLVSQLGTMSQEDIEKMIDAPNAQISSTIKEAVAYKSFYKSWLKVVADLGGFVEFKDFEYSVDGHDVLGMMTLVFEKGTAEFILTASEESMTVASIQVTKNQTLSEKMKKAGLNTLMGMGIVFSVLIFIAFLISLFKYINKAEMFLEKRKSNKESQIVKETEVIDESKAPIVLEPSPYEVLAADETRLVAVITAAVAASLNTSTDKLVVRSIKRRDSNQWRRD